MDEGVFRSADNGASWTEVNSGLTNEIVLSLAVSGTTLYAGTGGGGVFRSIDGGSNWSSNSDGLTNSNVQSLAVSGLNVYAGTSGGVFLSTDDTVTWGSINTGLTAFAVVFSLIKNHGDLYAGTKGGGVFRSQNDGASWTAVNTGLTNTIVRALAESGNNVYAGTSIGPFRSTNHGASWKPLTAEFPGAFVFSLYAKGPDLIAGTNGEGIWVSVNRAPTGSKLLASRWRPTLYAVSSPATRRFTQEQPLTESSSPQITASVGRIRIPAKRRMWTFNRLPYGMQFSLQERV